MANTNQKAWQKWLQQAPPEWQVALDMATSQLELPTCRWAFGDSPPASRQVEQPPLRLMRAFPGLGAALVKTQGQMTLPLVLALLEAVTLPVPAPETKKPIAFGRYEVTQQLYNALFPAHRSHFSGDPRLPVESVTWYDATAFCKSLTTLLGAVVEVRLPTEQEWEFAARAGQNFTYAGSDDPYEVAWTDDSEGHTYPVGQRKPNAWGLYDMSGNVWEWTSTEANDARVTRGGSWFIYPEYARVADRSYASPRHRNVDLGFRLCFDVPALKANPRYASNQRRNPDSRAQNAAEIDRMLAAMPSDWRKQLSINREKLAATTAPGVPERPDARSVLNALNLNNRDEPSSEFRAGQHPAQSVWKVPDAVRDAAMEGVRASYKNNYGGYRFIGVARAIQLATSEHITDDAAMRMRMYFDRKTAPDRLSQQYKDKHGKRYWSWLNWGGDPGARWVRSTKFEELVDKAVKENPRMRTQKNNPAPEQRTFAELMEELSWLGPASVVKLMLAGTTRQCFEEAYNVAKYLIERGFVARKDVGAGVYIQHYDLGVYTADRGWVSIDPTYVQFSLPNSEKHALSIAAEELGVDTRALSAPEKRDLIKRFFEPTVAWSVAGLQDPRVAFELRRPTKPTDKPAIPEKSSPPPPGIPTWRAFWQSFRTIAEDIAKTGESDEAEFYPGSQTYWFSELARRIQGKPISGSTVKENPYARAFPSLGVLYGIRKQGSYKVFEIVLYDRAAPGVKKRVLALGELDLGDDGNWYTSVMGATSEYGPLLYETAASLLGARIVPSHGQSEDAQRFWRRQGHPWIDPLTPAAWEAKYGQSWAAVTAQPQNAQALRTKALRAFAQVPLEEGMFIWKPHTPAV